MKTKQAFVILTPGWAASESDSTCLPMQQNLVRTINRVFPNLTVIILSFQYPYENKIYRWFGNTVMSFNGKNRGGFHPLLLRRKVARELEVIASETGIVGVLSFWYGECAAVAERFARKSGIPHKCWLLGQDARAGNKYPKRLSLKGGSLIALSDFIQREFERNYGKKPGFVLPPAVTNLPGDLPEKDIDLLAAGSLIPLKQYQTFLEVVAAIKMHRPQIKAVLIGEGPEKKLLQQLCDNLQVGNHLSIVGELQHTEVLAYMRRAKVFLHPSTYEGFGVVCLEALQSGAKVISFVQPMNTPIKNWSIVKSKEEMIEKSMSILSNDDISYEKTVVYMMEDLVTSLMDLYQNKLVASP